MHFMISLTMLNIELVKEMAIDFKSTIFSKIVSQWILPCFKDHLQMINNKYCSFCLRWVGVVLRLCGLFGEQAAR